MKIVIAIDSFKGSLTSLQAGSAAAEGIARVYPEAKTEIFPIADGLCNANTASCRIKQP